MKPRHFSHHDSNKPFHTHEYAKAAGETMGSTSSQPFSERYRIEQNRKHIKKYRDSHVATGSHLRQELKNRLNGDDTPAAVHPTHPAAAPLGGRSSSAARKGSAKMQRPSSGGSGVAPAPKPGFKEPPTRGFNPYS